MFFAARCNFTGACYNFTGAKNTFHGGSCNFTERRNTNANASCNFTEGCYINHAGRKSFLLTTCKFQLAYSKNQVYLLLKSLVNLVVNIVSCFFLGLLLTLVVWLVADFEAIIYQGTMNLIRGKNLKPVLQRQLTIPRVSNRPFLFFG
jgi:hypothetical protein